MFNADAELRTVTGPVPATDLGLTLTGEHLVADLVPTDPSGMLLEAPLEMSIFGEIDLGAINRENLTLTPDTAAGALEPFTSGGGRTVVEVTAIDQGRDLPALASLSAATGVNIIAGTGWTRSPSSDAGELTEALLADLERTDTPVGIIGRLGAHDASDPAGRAMIEAAGAAQSRTGAPILIEAGADPLATLSALEHVGANPSLVALTGVGPFVEDPASLLEAAGAGAFIQFTQIGRLTSLHGSWDYFSLAGAVGEFLQAGLSSKVLLTPGVASRMDLTSYGGGGLTFITENFGPFLGFGGVEPETFTSLLTTNAHSFLIGEDS